VGEDLRYDLRYEVPFAMSSYRQIDEGQRRESLRPIAVLRLAPEVLAERFTLPFVPGAGHLADTAAALLELTDGRQFMLLRHYDDPSTGTELLASERSETPAEDLRAFLDALDLADHDVTWALASTPSAPSLAR